jgi:1,4-dihydroxy-2-naphthoyl-CoA synthase
MQKSQSCLRILKASFREVFQLRRQSRRDWVGEFAPDFYQTGGTDEAKNAFLERRGSDFSASRADRWG